MRRRTLLKGATGLLSSMFLPPFLRPAGAERWGAISGVAPTHQFIVRQALAMLGQDPLWSTFSLPSADEITAQDFVFTNPGEQALTGTGPDVPGNSPYSWHYYNPDTWEGKAPEQVGVFFDLMVYDRVHGLDPSKGAAWAAHFLADMFVPYHTFGMPAGELDSFSLNRSWILNQEVCGDPNLMYSSFGPPPAGWGLGHDHTANVQRFNRVSRPGDRGNLDWFDPWYWNGYTEGTVGDATGSHQLWEFGAHQTLAPELPFFSNNQELLRRDSFYDPLWMNFPPLFQDEFWFDQRLAATVYAEECAKRTRASVPALLEDPTIGIAMAVRGVATLFRASMSSLAVAYHSEPLPDGGYKIVGTLHNRNPQASVTNLKVRLYTNTRDGKKGHIITLDGRLGPNAVHEVSWSIPGGEPHDGWIDASGEFEGVPDMGYAKVDFSNPGVEVRRTEPEQPSEESIDPETLSAWQGDWSSVARLQEETEWTAFPVVHVAVDGRTAVIRGPEGQGLSVSVTQGGRCISWMSPFDQRGYARMRACLSPDGDSFTGTIEGVTPGRPFKIDWRGTRR